MEHIPEHLVEDSLKEMLRVGSDTFLFSICLEKERCPLMGFIHTHITVKDKFWWIDTLSRVGFKNMGYDDMNCSGHDHITIKARKCQK
jgi:hypothetical protein